MILAIETATDICSVAFANEAGNVFEKRAESRGSHSEKLFLFIRELMQEHSFSVDDLEAVLVSEGPGSYTGLRIAASGVKGLLFGSDIPLFRAPTLASFACAALAEDATATRLHTIIDARRVHVYHQLFSVNNSMIKTNDEVEVIPIESFQKMIQPGDAIIGTGLNRLDHTVLDKAEILDKELISARSLIQLYKREEAGKFISKIEPKKFDPKYYTSNQG